MLITREEFRQIYHDTNVLQYEDIFYTEPKSDIDLINNYLTSKLWRLNNIYTIVDKHGKRRKFVMNKSQHIVYAESLRHPRLIVLKSRQQGISTLWLVAFFDDGITKSDLSIGLMAQGADEAEKLLERSKLLWDTLDENVKNYLGVSIIRDNTKEITFSTRSTLFIRTSFRSTTLQRLHVSEMGKIANKYPEKANETKTGTLQALAKGNIGVIESTAEGDNEFKTMWDNAYTFTGQRSPKDFSPIFLSWLQDPDCTEDIEQPIDSIAEKYFKEVEAELGIKLAREQKNFWIVQYRELGDRIYQEYPSTPGEAFRASKIGTYYAEEYNKQVIQKGRVVNNLYDPNLDVFAAIDLGVNDTNVIGVYQRYLDTFRIIDEYANHAKASSHYVDWMKEREWYKNLVELDLGHDGSVMEQTSGLTRQEAYEKELAKPRESDGYVSACIVNVLDRTSKMAGIDEVRKIIGRLWIDAKCTYTHKCMLNYRKEWNEKLQNYSNTPLHDEYSNGADMVRYIVVGGMNRTAGLYIPDDTGAKADEGFAL